MILMNDYTDNFRIKWIIEMNSSELPLLFHDVSCIIMEVSVEVTL